MTTAFSPVEPCRLNCLGANTLDKGFDFRAFLSLVRIAATVGIRDDVAVAGLLRLGDGEKQKLKR